MEVTVKLFAILGKYLPPHATYNEAQMDIAAGTSVSQLIDQTASAPGVDPSRDDQRHLHPPRRREQTMFSPGDEFAVFPPVTGG